MATEFRKTAEANYVLRVRSADLVHTTVMAGMVLVGAIAFIRSTVSLLAGLHARRLDFHVEIAVFSILMSIWAMRRLGGMVRVHVDQGNRLIEFRNFWTRSLVNQLPIGSLKAVSVVYRKGQRTHWYAVVLFREENDLPLALTTYTAMEPAVALAMELSGLTNLPYVPETALQATG
jgi:hypothetical protein